MRYIIFSLFLWVIFVNTAHAQSARILSLEECIRMAQNQSPAAKMANMGIEAATFSYEAFTASLKPQLNFSADLPGLRRSYVNIQQDDGSPKFVYQSQTYSDVSLNVNQVLPLTGGSVSVFSSLSNFSFLSDNGFTNWRSNPFGIRINQPLFQLNAARWNKTEQNMRFDLAKIDYYQELENIAVDITRRYFSVLIAQQGIRRAQNNVINNDTIFNLSQGRFSVGKIAENELLESELNLMNARADLSQAQMDYERSLEELITTLGLEKNAPLEISIPEELPEITVDPDEAVAQAMTFSRQVKNNQLSQLLAERNVRAATSGNRFSADITASFGLNQTGSSFNEAFTNPIDQEFFSVGLNVPILQWGAGKAEIDAAETLQEQTRLRIEQQNREYEVDIYYQVQNLRQLKNQVEISNKSDDVASRRYEITRNRYLIGKITIQELFIAQREKDQAQINRIANLQTFWIALAELRAATLYDFVEMRPVIIH
ncbi:MAG: TolC family protein [Bacteroidia bacterium]|nr:TolC family protein [Bacteroidia bacterium]